MSKRPHRRSEDALDHQFFKQARPLSEALGGILLTAIEERRRRGPQAAPKKKPISIRLDPVVVDTFKATGKGWQNRINDVLVANLPTKARSEHVVVHAGRTQRHTPRKKSKAP